MKPTDADYPAREAVTALVAAALDASPFCTILNLGQGLHDSLSRGDTGQPGPVVPYEACLLQSKHRSEFLLTTALENEQVPLRTCSTSKIGPKHHLAYPPSYVLF